MENLLDYIINDALIVIPVLLVLGKIMKDTPGVKDWLIPYMVLLFGTGITLVMIGFNVDAFIQGVLVSGAAVFGNQLWKQTMEGVDKK